MCNFTIKESENVHALMYSCLLVCSTPSVTLLTARLKSPTVTECLSLGSKEKLKLNLRTRESNTTASAPKYDLQAKSCFAFCLICRGCSLCVSFDVPIKPSQKFSELLLYSPLPPSEEGRDWERHLSALSAHAECEDKQAALHCKSSGASN